MTRRFHASSKFMHDEKNSCLVKICTSREDFIPRWKLCIAGRFISRENLRIAGRYSCPARGRTWIKKEQYLSIGLDCILLFLIKVNIKESIEGDNKRNINIATSFIYLFRNQVWNTLKMISWNTRHKLYLLDVRPIESMSSMEGNKEVSTR